MSRPPADVEGVEPYARDAIPSHSLDAAWLSLIRCVLAFTALIVLPVQAAETARLSELIGITVAGYTVFAVVIARMARDREWAVPPRWLHWTDAAFFSCMMFLSGGAQSAYFFCFFFPVIVAAFCYGFREGLTVTVACIASYLSFGLWATEWTPDTELNRIILRPVYLLALGYMIAFWGGHELRLKRQLLLLHNLSRVRNPRVGLEFTVVDGLRKLREFYGADHCVLITQKRSGEDSYRVHRSSAAGSDDADVEARLSSDAARRLVAEPAADAITYDTRLAFGRPEPSCTQWNVSVPLRRSAAPADWCSYAARVLGARCFISVPYVPTDAARGRVFVASRTPFSVHDVAFVLHFAELIAVLVENTALVEELVSTAAERERSRIALDIHDSAVQPYIGLRMALQGLYREAEPDNPMKAPLGEIIAMADAMVQDLRAYASGVRRAELPDNDVLIAAVREQAERYERFYGMQVKVDIDKVVFGSLSSDIYHIIVEGLSNIRKHTSANKAFVRVMREALAFRIQIGNESQDPNARQFTPRSIQQRAQTLGGTVCVGVQDGYTLVDVNVPL
jgi:signal transduction histidine kinase